MIELLKRLSVGTMVAVAVIAVGSTVAGQGQPPAGGQGRGRAAAPPPPEPQAGHPSGKLVIWGDLASFDKPATVPTHCILTNRFKRAQLMGFRMAAIDGGSGEVENTAAMVVHLKYAGGTIDVPMRWRGQGPFPASEYPRQPSEMWTAAWSCPPTRSSGP